MSLLSTSIYIDVNAFQRVTSYSIENFNTKKSVTSLEPNVYDTTIEATKINTKGHFKF